MVQAVRDLSDEQAKARLINHVRTLRGRWRIDLTQYRPRRSDRQNRYYWPCLVQPFAAWLKEQGNEYTTDDAHEILKHKFLRREHIDRRTGEVMTFTQSTAKLDTSEFNEYLDRCAAWLADFTGIEVPDPQPYHERESA